jgi:hypothetical protein
MLRSGILTKQQFLALGEDRWRSSSYVAYNLLDVGVNPTAEDVQVFESLSFALHTSNGTFRTTFRNRFPDLDALAIGWMQRLFPAGPMRVEDRAVSHGLTSAEWARKLLPLYPDLQFESSDLMLELLELTLHGNAIYITEANGTPLQYIRPPFVVPLDHPGARRYFLNRAIAAFARHQLRQARLPSNWMETSQGPGYRVRKIPFIHPEAAALLRTDPRFHFACRSVFELTPPERACHVIRTMNILNRDYFSEQRLAEASTSIHGSLRPGGLWIVGRTMEDNFSNHVSLLQRQPTGWEVLERIGKGSEIEALVLQTKVAG